MDKVLGCGDSGCPPHLEMHPILLSRAQPTALSTSLALTVSCDTHATVTRVVGKLTLPVSASLTEQVFDSRHHGGFTYRSNERFVYRVYFADVGQAHPGRNVDYLVSTVTIRLGDDICEYRGRNRVDEVSGRVTDLIIAADETEEWFDLEEVFRSFKWAGLNVFDCDDSLSGASLLVSDAIPSLYVLHLPRPDAIRTPSAAYSMMPMALGGFENTRKRGNVIATMVEGDSVAKHLEAALAALH